MRLLTPSQARELDRVSMGKMGIPGETLMANAGICISQQAMEMVANIHDPFILIICGKGNNAGDGFAAASILIEKKYKVRIHTINHINEL